MRPTVFALPALVWTHPGNRGRRVRALSRLLAWQAWERTTGRPFTITLAAARRLRCEPHSTSASGVMYFGLPDWPEMNLMLDYLRPGDVFLDVGANVGVYSLLATVVSDVEVWAFEPSLAAFKSASANVALNRLEASVHLVQAAVGADQGTVLLTVGLGTVNHIMTPMDAGEAVSVPLVALDTHLGVSDRQRVAMMKIDVEGNELAVLNGARELIRSSQPVLIVEANDVEGLSSWLSGVGYRPFQYAPERGELSETTWHAPPTGNIIAVADQVSAQQRVRSISILADGNN